MINAKVVEGIVLATVSYVGGLKTPSIAAKLHALISKKITTDVAAVETKVNADVKRL